MKINGNSVAIRTDVDVDELIHIMEYQPITTISLEETVFEEGKKAGIRAVYDTFYELQNKKMKQIVPSRRSGKMHIIMLCKLCEEIKEICLKLEDDI